MGINTYAIYQVEHNKLAVGKQSKKINEWYFPPSLRVSIGHPWRQQRRLSFAERGIDMKLTANSASFVPPFSWLHLRAALSPGGIRGEEMEG